MVHHARFLNILLFNFIYITKAKIVPLYFTVKDYKIWKIKMHCFENLVSITKKIKMASKNIQPTKYSYQKNILQNCK